jgi:hypothetical protein
VPRLTLLVAGLLPQKPSYHTMWDLWETKCHCEIFYWAYLAFFSPTFYQFSIIIYSVLYIYIYHSWFTVLTVIVPLYNTLNNIEQQCKTVAINLCQILHRKVPEVHYLWGKKRKCTVKQNTLVPFNNVLHVSVHRKQH